jgi:hypothetical protein
MRELLQFIVLAFGIPLAVTFLRAAWCLWRMPESERKELRESYYRRKKTNEMIRFWLSGGKH